MKAHRLLEKPPPYHKDFGASCIAWWMHLQPVWRTNDGNVPHAVYTCDDGDWGTLKKTGKNGIFMILLVMSWWACGAGKVPPVWTKLVVDITRALESMAAAPGEELSSSSKKTKVPALKRKHGPDPAPAVEKRSGRA